MSEAWTGIERWTEPGFVAEAHRWAREACARAGRRVAGEITQPHIRPWSTVFQVPTADGAVFLKACGENQAHEPRLTALLAAARPDLLPPVLALHDQRPWMLVADGGARLRDVAPPPALDEWASVLARYAELQRDLAPRAQELVAIGTPDHRLRRVAAMLGEVLADPLVVRGLDPEVLSVEEHRRLRAALPRLAEAGAELAALGVPDSIQHDDLHDGNVLVRGDRRVVFDWGDACVSHPFFTLTVTLRFIAEGSSLDLAGPEIRRLRDAYLEPWTSVVPAAGLVAGADLARRLGPSDRVLTWYRVLTLVDEPARERILPGVLDWLREALLGIEDAAPRRHLS